MQNKYAYVQYTGQTLNTLFTLYCTVYSVHCTMNGVLCTMYTVHCTVYTEHDRFIKYIHELYKVMINKKKLFYVKINLPR